jgi:hypothetical protein
MATKKKQAEPEEQQQSQDPWDPEKVRRFRMAYDKQVKDGNLPKDPRKVFSFEGSEYNMAFAYYLLEYFETVIFWPPQSRAYNVAPELNPIEPDKS